MLSDPVAGHAGMVCPIAEPAVRAIEDMQMLAVAAADLRKGLSDFMEIFGDG